MKKCILMDPADNVATVLEKVDCGDELDVVDKKLELAGKVKACGQIPFAHKVCVSPIEKGGDIIKFGIAIGRAVEAIAVGDYAHIHNIISIEGTEKVRQEGEK